MSNLPGELLEQPEPLDDGEDPGDDWDDSDVGLPAAPAVREATLRRARVPGLLEDVATGVMKVRRAERDLDKRVRAARAHGASWEDIGIATGLSRQGAAKRWG